MYYEVTYISPIGNNILHSQLMQNYSQVQTRWNLYREMGLQFRIWMHYFDDTGKKTMVRIK